MNPSLCITYHGSTVTYQALSDIIVSGLQKPTDWERSFGRRCLNMRLNVEFLSFEDHINAVKAERAAGSPTTMLHASGVAASLATRIKPVVLHVYFSDCQTGEGYKASRVREQITVWLSEIRSHHPCHEWALIVLANTDTSGAARLYGNSSRMPFKNSSSSAASGGVGQTSSSTVSGGKFEVADRIRADFCSRSLSDKHRCLIFRSPKSKNFQQDEFWWSSVNELRAIIFGIVEQKLRMYEDSVRRLREDRQSSNFNILQCFCTQNHLAGEYQQLGLLEDSLLQLDEMDAMLTLFIEESHQKSTTDILRRPCRDFNAPNLTLFQQPTAALHREVRECSQSMQDVLTYVAANAADHVVLDRYDINILRLRNHLFMRQCYLLIQQQRGWEIPLRAVALIHCLLHELNMLLNGKSVMPSSATEKVAVGAVESREQYLNALNAWSFLLALQCIEVANEQARSSNAANMQNSSAARSEISFDADVSSSPSTGGATGPFNSVRVQQANATLLDIARLKLRELGIQQKIAPTLYDSDAGISDQPPGADEVKAAKNSAAVIVDFGAILPATFPHEARQRLLRALASSAAFTTYYLEFSEFVLGTCKHVGRIRGARLIGKELAAYYVSANEPEKATAFLRDAIKSYKYEGWSQLAVSSMSLYAECCYQAGNFERTVKDALLVASSNSEKHSLESRKRFMRMAFHAARKLQDAQQQKQFAGGDSGDKTSPVLPSSPGGAKTIKTAQIFTVRSASRCNGECPMFVSKLSSHVYAVADKEIDVSTAISNNASDPSTSEKLTDGAAASEGGTSIATSYSHIMLKVVFHSALPEIVSVSRNSVKCLLRYQPLTDLKHKRSLSVAVTEKSASSDPAQQQHHIPLLSLSSSHHGGHSAKGSSLPRHYSAMNFAQLAKQQTTEQQEVSAGELLSNSNKSRPDNFGDDAAAVRRPGSAHVGAASKPAGPVDDDSAALAAISGSTTVRHKQRDLVMRLMSRPSVSGPDHFLALKQEQSGMTSNKSSSTADSRRRKQSSFSRMSSVVNGSAGATFAAGGGKLMNVKRIVTYGTSTSAVGKMLNSSSVSGPLAAFAENTDGRNDQQYTAAAAGGGGASSAKSTPTHRGLAASSALRKSANKAASKLFSTSSSSSALASSATADSISDDGGRQSRNIDAGGSNESEPLFVVAASSAPSDSLLGGESVPSLQLSSSVSNFAKDEDDAASISRVSIASGNKPITGVLALPPGARDSFRTARETVTSAGLVCIPYESAASQSSSPAYGGGAAADSTATSPIQDLCADALSLTPSRSESYVQQSSTLMERGISLASYDEVNADDDDMSTDASDDDETGQQSQTVIPQHRIRRPPVARNFSTRQYSVTESSGHAPSVYANSDTFAEQPQHRFVVLKVAPSATADDADEKLMINSGINTLLFEGQLEESGIYEPFALFIELIPRVVNIFSPIVLNADNATPVSSPAHAVANLTREQSVVIHVDNKPPQLSVLTDAGELYSAVPQKMSLKLVIPPQNHGVVVGADINMRVRLVCRPLENTANDNAGNNAELLQRSPLAQPVFLLKSDKDRINSCWAAESVLSEAENANNLNEKAVTLRADHQFESEQLEILIPAHNTADEVELLVVVDYPWNSLSKSADGMGQTRERSATEATLVDGSPVTRFPVDDVGKVASVHRFQFILARHKIRNTFSVESRQIATCKPDEHMLQVVLTCRYAARFLLHNPVLELLSHSPTNTVQIVGDALGVQNFRSGWMPFKQGSRAVFTWRLASSPTYEYSERNLRDDKNSCKFLFSMDYGIDERLYGADATSNKTDINTFVSHMMAYKQDSTGHIPHSGRQSRTSVVDGVGGGRDVVDSRAVGSLFFPPFLLQNLITASVQSRLVNVRICLRDQNKPLCRLGDQFFVKYRISIAFSNAKFDQNEAEKLGMKSDMADSPLDLYYRVRLPQNQDSPDWKVISGETGSLSLNAAAATRVGQQQAFVSESGDGVANSKHQASTESREQNQTSCEGDVASSRRTVSGDETGSQTTIQPILQPLRSGILQLPKLQLFTYRQAGLEELTSTLVYYENPCVLITVFVEEMPNNVNDVLVSDNDEIEVH